MECLFHTIKELYQRKSSLRVGRETLRPLDSEVSKHGLLFENVHSFKFIWDRIVTHIV